jgi:tetratricopeptide (TPR) repeat protein
MENPGEAEGTPPMRESGALRRAVYRAAFWTGLGLVGLSVVVGVGASWRAGGSLPAFRSDALVEARRLEAAGDLPRAFEQYRRAAVLQAGVAAYSSSFADALFRHRRLKEADAWYRAASRIDPTLAGAYAGLGEIALEEVRLDDAAQFFTQALRLEPGSLMLHNELGVTQALRGRFPEAMAEFDAAVRLGGGAQAMGNLERARRDAARATSGGRP